MQQVALWQKRPLWEELDRSLDWDYVSWAGYILLKLCNLAGNLLSEGFNPFWLTGIPAMPEIFCSNCITYTTPAWMLIFGNNSDLVTSYITIPTHGSWAKKSLIKRSAHTFCTRKILLTKRYMSTWNDIIHTAESIIWKY